MKKSMLCILLALTLLVLQPPVQAVCLSFGLQGQAQISHTDADFDQDGVDDSFDNCLFVGNTDQIDFDADGYGNVCDGDIDNDGDTDGLDLALMALSRFHGDTEVADLNGDELIDHDDLRIFALLFSHSPGPTGRIPNLENRRPTANAGDDQSVALETLTFLDGSRSSDLDGDRLSFVWSILTSPATSVELLYDSNSVRPTFKTDQPGTYVIQLQVDDGTATSQPSTVVLSTENTPPVANAGDDRNIVPGETLELDGSGSFDIDGDALQFFWKVVEPGQQHATVVDPFSMRPTVTLGSAEKYVVELVVSDGNQVSRADQCVLTADNVKPVADAGPPQRGTAGETITLDGSNSWDADGDPLLFQWHLISVPEGSNSELFNPNDSKPFFSIDRNGIYVAQLIVNDGIHNSIPSTVVITTTNSRPYGVCGQEMVVPVGSVVSLDTVLAEEWPAVDPEGNPLTYLWALTVKPEGSIATLSDPMDAAPVFMADMVGYYLVQLIACDETLCSTPKTTVFQGQLSPVAHAGEDQTVLLGTTVYLNGLASYDPSGGQLFYSWVFTSGPTGADPVLANEHSATPSFFASHSDQYEFELTVNNGVLPSLQADKVVIDVNQAPTVHLQAPHSDSIFYSGDNITIAVSAEDADGEVVRVEFYESETKLGHAIQPPFCFDWSDVSPGIHTIHAVVYDNKGAVTSSETVEILVMALEPSIVTLKGRQVLVQRRRIDGTLEPQIPYIIRGVNWSPASVDTNISPSSPNYAAVMREEFHKWYNQDILMMSRMNVNTVRLYIDPGVGSSLDKGLAVMNALHKNGIMVVMTVDDGHNDTSRIEQVVNSYKSHPALLMWSLGNEWNLNRYYGTASSPLDAVNRTEQAATLIKTLDSTHPVVSSYGDLTYEHTQKYVQEVAKSVDIWSFNIYSGKSLLPTIKEWELMSHQPMFIGEFGTDCFRTADTTNPPSGMVDEEMQADWVIALWNDIFQNLSGRLPHKVCIGGFVFEWNDEWYKGGFPSVHNTSGFRAGHPDEYSNEEYYGIVDINRNPRLIYHALGKAFHPNGPPLRVLKETALIKASSQGGKTIIHWSATARFYKDGDLLYYKTGGAEGGRGFNVAWFDEQTMELRDVRRFDTWASRYSGAAHNELISFLDTIPDGAPFAVAVADEAGLNLNDSCTFRSREWVNKTIAALESLGSQTIGDICFRDSWAMVGVKGDPNVSEEHKPTETAVTEQTISIEEIDPIYLEYDLIDNFYIHRYYDYDGNTVYENRVNGTINCGSFIQNTCGWINDHHAHVIRFNSETAYKANGMTFFGRLDEDQVEHMVIRLNDDDEVVWLEPAIQPLGQDRWLQFITTGTFEVKQGLNTLNLHTEHFPDANSDDGSIHFEPKYDLRSYFAFFMTDGQDADSDGIPDKGPEGEDKNSDGIIDPLGTDGIPATEDDETNPFKKDTDDDGYNDDEEIYRGTSPNDPFSVPGKGPKVVSMIPENEQTDVFVTTFIKLQFNEPVTVGDFVQEHFLYPYNSAAPIPGSIKLLEDNQTLIFIPETYLVGNTEYSVKVGYGIQNSEGYHLNFFVSTFTTGTGGNIEVLQVAESVPQNGETKVSVNQKVTVKFTKEVDPDSINPNCVYLNDLGSGANLAVDITVSSDFLTLTIIPQQALEYETRYQLTLTSDIIGLNGYPMAYDHTFRFLTEIAPGVLDTDNDGLSDQTEIDFGSDPTMPDEDGDNWTGGNEYLWNTDPKDSDTDQDGYNDGQDPAPKEESKDFTITFSDNGNAKDDIWTLSLAGQSCRNPKGGSATCTFHLEANWPYTAMLHAEWDEDEPTTYEINFDEELSVLGETPFIGTMEKDSTRTWQIMYETCRANLSGPKVLTVGETATYRLNCLAPTCKLDQLSFYGGPSVSNLSVLSIESYDYKRIVVEAQEPGESEIFAGIQCLYNEIERIGKSPKVIVIVISCEELAQQIALLKSKLKQLEEELAQKKLELEELELQLENCDFVLLKQEIESLEAAIAEAEKTFAEAVHMLAELDLELIACNKELKDLQGELLADKTELEICVDHNGEDSEICVPIRDEWEKSAKAVWQKERELEYLQGRYDEWVAKKDNALNNIAFFEEDLKGKKEVLDRCVEQEARRNELLMDIAKLEKQIKELKERITILQAIYDRNC